MSNDPTNQTSHIPPRRRVRRPLVDYAAIDEENRRKAEAAGKKPLPKPKFDPVIGKENPHARPGPTPKKLQPKPAKGADKTK